MVGYYKLWQVVSYGENDIGQNVYNKGCVLTKNSFIKNIKNFLVKIRIFSFLLVSCQVLNPEWGKRLICQKVSHSRTLD